jgi:ATP-dependent protease ClpP protease subunit
MTSMRNQSPSMSLRPSAKTKDTYDLLIHGDIGASWYSEGVEAKAIADQIDSLPDSVKTLNVRINSFGGSVSEGFGIHNAIRSFRGRTVAVVEGVACSIASLIMMAADEVRAYPQSLILVHAPWSGASGNAKDMRKTADVLDKWAEAMVSAYTRKGTMAEADVRQLLTSGEDHWYTADEAKSAGLIDTVVDEESVTDSAKAMLDRAPTAMRFAALAAFRGVVPPQDNQPQEVPVDAPQIETPVATAVDDVQARVDAAVTAAVAAAVAKVEAEAQARVSEAQALAADAQARAAAEVEAREIRDAVDAASKAFAHVPGTADEIGRALRSVAKLAPEAAAVLDRVLRASDAALAAGALTTPVGASSNTESTPEERLETLTNAKLAADPKLTAVQARAMVYTENADIVAALRGEKD